jgi:hypothetical protein
MTGKSLQSKQLADANLADFSVCRFGRNSQQSIVF